MPLTTNNWGSFDPFGLTGDTQQQPDDTSSLLPGANPALSAEQQIAQLTGAETGLSAAGPPQLLTPSTPPLTSASAGIPGISGIGSLIGGGSQIGSLISSLLGPLFGLNASTSGGEGGTIGGFAGGALGSIFGPIGTLGGSAIGDLLGSLIGNWIGGGVPSEAKPTALVNTLETSGNPVENELGKYIFNSGISRGYDLSEPANSVPFNPAREGDVLQLLSGEALPHQITAQGGGFQNEPTLAGWKNLSQLQALEPGATNLNFNQIGQIRQLIARLVNASNNQSLQGLLGEENTLATKLRNAESY
jgi:hypothetical protein